MTKKPETKSTETNESQYITLKEVGVRSILIHDGQFESHYEDMVELDDVRRLVDKANRMIAIAEGKVIGLQSALNALMSARPVNLPSD